MACCWSASAPVTVREVLDCVNATRPEPVAYTTVMTTLHRLRAKGKLTAERHGRSFRYVATATQAQLAADVMVDAVRSAAEDESVLRAFVEAIDDKQRAVLLSYVSRLTLGEPDDRGGRVDPPGGPPSRASGPPGTDSPAERPSG